MLYRWGGRVPTLLRRRTLEVRGWVGAAHRRRDGYQAGRDGYQAGWDGYQAGREGHCTGRVDESRPSSEDEHPRYVLTGHTLTSVGWGQGPGLSMEGWMELGVRLGGGRGGVGSRARLGSGGGEVGLGARLSNGGVE